MSAGRLGALLVLLGIGAGVGAVGCIITHDEDDLDTANDEVNEIDIDAQVLKSTLLLESGCMAVKVGPRQLLLAARCVSGRPGFEAGSTLKFKVAAGARGLAPSDGGAGVDAEAGSPPPAKNIDGGAKRANTSKTNAVIESIAIEESFTAKCTSADGCPIGSLATSDVKDIAVITLDANLIEIPTIKVDLDSVGQSDPLVTVSAGCEKVDAKPGAIRATRTMAVPAESVRHPGSVYEAAPELVTRLAASYVVTPARGWRSTETGLCKNDIGAPLFRSGQNVVAGVTAGFTTFSADMIIPVTLEHTKVDGASKVGEWLASLDVETTHSCSEAAGGCVKRAYDGGAPGSTLPATSLPGAVAEGDDAGLADGGDGAGEDDPGGQEVPLGEGSSGGEYSTHDPEYADGGKKKKKKKVASACSAAPGPISSSTGMPLAFGLALALVALRRRRCR